MAMTIAMERKNIGKRRPVLEPRHESYVGMDLMDVSAENALTDENPSWLQKLTCTPAGLVGLVLLTIVLSPVLIVFGAFYGAFRPFGR